MLHALMWSTPRKLSIYGRNMATEYMYRVSVIQAGAISVWVELTAVV